MHTGFHPQHQLESVERHQAGIRAQARRASYARRASRRIRERMPVAFRLGRLHVMLWLDGARKA